MSDAVIHLYVHLDQPVENLSLSIYMPSDSQADLAEIKELVVATKEEVLAAIDVTKASLAELSKDVTRIIADLQTAIADKDLTAVAAGIADLQTVVAAIDDAVEVASPEPAPTPEPTP